MDKRLERGDQPKNLLDLAARDHDILYSQFKDIKHRHLADEILEKKAWERVKSRDANLSERAVALLTAGAMRVKRKLGMGLPRSRWSIKKAGKGLKQTPKPRRRKTGKGLKRKGKRKTGKGVSFKQLVSSARKSIRNMKKNQNIEALTGKALDAVHREVTKKKRKFRVPRVIPIPKSGGALPLIPILAGISALGGAATGVSSIVRSIGEILDAKRKMFPGDKKKVGNGLYLAPYRKNGHGLYLAPYLIKN